MSQIVNPSNQTQPATAAQVQPVAPTIAIRKSCNPDGIGLSHYVLMDRKAAKGALSLPSVLPAARFSGRLISVTRFMPR